MTHSSCPLLSSSNQSLRNGIRRHSNDVSRDYDRVAVAAYYYDEHSPETIVTVVL